MSTVDFEGFNLAQSAEIIAIAAERAAARQKVVARWFPVLVTAGSIIGVGAMLGLGL